VDGDECAQAAALGARLSRGYQQLRLGRQVKVDRWIALSAPRQLAGIARPAHDRGLKLNSSEPPTEEAESAIPRLLRPDSVVLGLRYTSRPDGGLVRKGMACKVAVEVEGYAGFA
jgi:hypothetical protein